MGIEFVFCLCFLGGGRLPAAFAGETLVDAGFQTGLLGEDTDECGLRAVADAFGYRFKRKMPVIVDVLQTAHRLFDTVAVEERPEIYAVFIIDHL